MDTIAPLGQMINNLQNEIKEKKKNDDGNKKLTGRKMSWQDLFIDEISS